MHEKKRKMRKVGGGEKMGRVKKGEMILGER